MQSDQISPRARILQALAADPRTRLLHGHRFRAAEALPWILAVVAYFAFDTYLSLGIAVLIAVLFTLSLDLVIGYAGIAGLRADGVVLEGTHAYVHGAGGVGENIAWSLAAEPIASLTIFDIDTVRAGQLAERIAAWRARGDATTIARKGGVLTEEDGAAQHAAPAGLGFKAITVDDPRALPLSRIAAGTPDWKNLGLAINASPVGLETTHPLPFAVDALPLSAVVADVIMEPARTKLLKAAQARGLKPHHGRNMMNFGLPLAAAFFGLPSEHEWHGGAIQGG